MEWFILIGVACLVAYSYRLSQQKSQREKAGERVRAVQFYRHEKVF